MVTAVIFLWSWHRRTHTDAHTHIHTCKHTCKHMHRSMHIDGHIGVYACVHSQTHTHAHKHTHTNTHILYIYIIYIIYKCIIYIYALHNVFPLFIMNAISVRQHNVTLPPSFVCNRWSVILCFLIYHLEKETTVYTAHSGCTYTP